MVINILDDSCQSQTSTESRYDVNIKWDFHISIKHSDISMANTI